MGAFSDPDGHTLKSVKIVTLPAAAHGTLKVGTTAATAGQTVAVASLGTITFEPVANWNGTASFTYKVTDTSDAESAAAATVSITVSAADDAPTASNISKSTGEDTTLTFAAADFTGAYSDADGHTLKSVKIATLPAATHGTLKSGNPLAAVGAGDSIAAADLGTITFEPAANWNGTASFTFTVTDSSDQESAAPATVTITVNAEEVTVSVADASATEGSTVTFTATLSVAVSSNVVLGWSTGDDDTTGARQATAGTDYTAVTNGSVTIDANQTEATFTVSTMADTDTEGDETFKVTISETTANPLPDGVAIVAASAIGTIEDDDIPSDTSIVNPVDDAPTASNITKAIDEDSPLTFTAADFTGAFSDPDGHTLKSVKIVTLPDAGHGTLKVGTAAATAGQTVMVASLGTITFEPVANWNGTASFTFKVTDTSGQQSASASTVTVIVTPVNDPPEANAGTDLAVDPGANVTLDGSGSRDTEDTSLTFAWTQTSGTEVTLQGAATVTPSFIAPQAPGALSFRLTVTDPGGLTASDTVAVTVRDTAPSFGGAAVAALTLERGRPTEPVVLPAATGGNGALSYRLTSEPAGLAGLAFDAATRTLSGTPKTVGDYVFSHRADDADDNRSDTDAAVLTFAVTVEAATAERKEAVTRTLAAVGARTLASALDNIGARFADTDPATSVTLANERLPLAAPAAPAVASGTPGGMATACSSAEGCGDLFGTDIARGRRVEIDELLHSSDFSWTPAADEAADPRAPRISIWGRGEVADFAGRPETGSSYEGQAWTGWLGADTRSGAWLGGVAMSHGVSHADYRFGDAPDERGRLETSLTALYPYGRWTPADGFDLRVILGIGVGEVRHAPEGGEPEESGLSMWLASVGARKELPAVAGIDLAARAEASFARMQAADVPEVGQGIDGLRADSWRARLGLEASRRFVLGEGRTLAPFMEAVGRVDGGDGLSGTGLELAGGLRYAGAGVQIEARGRLLAAYTEVGVQERGLSLTARLNPAADGQGLHLALTPRWGARTGGAEALWRDEMPQLTGSAGAETASFDASIGYGFALADGVLTPFAEGGLGPGENRVRVGTRIKASTMPLSVELSGERRERSGSAPEYGFNLEVKFSY